MSGCAWLATMQSIRSDTRSCTSSTSSNSASDQARRCSDAAVTTLSNSWLRSPMASARTMRAPPFSVCNARCRSAINAALAPKLRQRSTTDS